MGAIELDYEVELVGLKLIIILCHLTFTRLGYLYLHVYVQDFECVFRSELEVKIV